MDGITAPQPRFAFSMKQSKGGVKEMKRRILSIVTALCMLGSGILPQMTAQAAEAGTAAKGTTYYVSTKNGSDRNDGRSQSKPFYSLQKVNDLKLKPGDKILLECGSVFTNGYMHLEGQKGTEEAPIIIDKYGSGHAPIINTNGQGIWFQNYGGNLDNGSHKKFGYVSSSILLYDTEYIEIRNLEITNAGANIDTNYNAIDTMNRTGVAAVAQNGGTLDHIYLDGLNVHDVYGNVYDKHMNNGGIYFTAFIPANEAKTGIARYDDVRIENCKVEKVNRWGIGMGYSAYQGRFGDREIADETIIKYGHTNVLLRNNYLKDVGGDAITTFYCYRPIIEYNISDGAARQINFEDYAHAEDGNHTANWGRVAAAIWPWKCKDAVFQYNECFDTANAYNGNGDGQAWDADSGDGTIYQYNYSHNNSGGCVMFCYPKSCNNIFRYNISQNDLGGVINNTVNWDAHIYNNVFYIKEGVPFIRDGMAGGSMVVENNIIYNSGKKAISGDWNHGINEWNTPYFVQTEGARPATYTYSHNLYYNYTNKPADDMSAVRVSAGTKVFEDPGKAPAAPADKVRRHEDPAVSSVFDGYRLAENSPAINRGKFIANAGDIDFFGQKLGGTPDIGAYESSVVGLKVYSLAPTELDVDIDSKTISLLSRRLTVKEFIKKLSYHRNLKVSVYDEDNNRLTDKDNISGGCKVAFRDGETHIVYKLAKGSGAGMSSSYYMTDDSKNIYVPMKEQNPTTVSALRSGITTIGGGADVKVYDGETELKTGAVADGMTLKVVSDDGLTEDAYTIKEKSSYNWYGDFANGQQGNVWYAQRKENSVYSNMAADTWNDIYKTWEGASYSCIGIDQSFGLLCDAVEPAQRREGYSVAFRAPASGKVELSFADLGDGNKNARLRQASAGTPNTGGNTYLNFTCNGKEIGERVQLPNDGTGIALAPITLNVARGDYIRVEAQNEGNPNRCSIHVTPIITYLDEKPADVTPPVMSTAVKASEIKTTSVKLSWNAAEDDIQVQGYRIYDGRTRLGDTKNTSITISGLRSDHYYVFDVVAYDAAGNESIAAPVRFATAKFIPVSSVKLNKTSATLTAGGSVQLTATVSPKNATNGKITWKTSASSVAKVSTTGKVSTVAPGKATITATADGKSASCAVYVVPKATTSVAYTAKSTSSISLSWKKVSGASGYTVYRYDSKTKKDVAIYTAKSGATVSYTVSRVSGSKGAALSAGTSYTFRVAPYKTISGKNYYGSKKSVTGTTKCKAPTLSKVSRSSSTKAKATWKKTTGASGYEIYYSTKKSSGYKKVKTVSNKTTSYTKTGLKKGKTYYFKVRAYRKVGGKTVYSSYSAVKSIKLK